MLTYEHFSIADLYRMWALHGNRHLRGPLIAEVLIHAEATLSIRDREAVIFREADFPVAELARSLWSWRTGFAGGPFRFDSMSFEELGVVSITEEDGGWVLGSAFSDSVSRPVPWCELDGAVTSFCTRVAADLACVGLDTSAVFG